MAREHIKQYLRKRTKNWSKEQADNFICYFLNLYDDSKADGLIEDNFETELIKSEETFHQCFWELELARILKSLGYKPTRPKGKGGAPDFRIEHNGKVVWVEAITPEKGGSPDKVPDYGISDASKEIFEVFPVPSEQILKRYTSAIRSKKDKLDVYKEGKIIKHNEAYIIAINPCLLGCWLDTFCDTSQIPFAVTAVFPFGAETLTISRKTRTVVDRGYEYRPVVSNHNNAIIRTDTFLDNSYKYISGIYAIDGRTISYEKKIKIESAFVHNPLAKNSVPIGFMGRDIDYYVKNPHDEQNYWELYNPGICSPNPDLTGTEF